MTNPAEFPSAPETNENSGRFTLWEGNEFWDDQYLATVPIEDLIIALVEHALRQLQLVFGPRYGKEAAAAAVRSVGSLIDESPRDDFSFVRQSDVPLFHLDIKNFDFREFTAEFGHLFRFARYGEAPYSQHGCDEAAMIEQLLCHFRKVAADPSLRAAGGENFLWVIETTAAAQARWALDHGLAVRPDDLAALAAVEPKTIANLLASRELTAGPDGGILAAGAMRFLERCENFKYSTWRDAAAAKESEDTPNEAKEGDAVLAEQVFVPVDSNDQPFLPYLARAGRDGVPRYIIGTKAEPEYVEDYWEALARLASMSIPGWQRPPAYGYGGWSLVTAQAGWQRFARLDIQRMINAWRPPGWLA